MPLKYSILLPTKNGGKYLKHCINAVLNQSYQNIELVVSDNANNDETSDIIRKYQDDARLISVRLKRQVSVTENWNNALNLASGDYILMLGDDDLLFPESISKLDKIINQQNRPECLTYNAFGYIAPNSIMDNQDSYYSDIFFKYTDEFRSPRILSRKERIQIVKKMYMFKVDIPLNMQTTIISSNVIEKIKEGIFKAPFPDQYALNALLLNADNWFFTPEKILIIGISPKSFGHYVYSNKQNKGREYLALPPNDNPMLPGNELLNNMCIWLKKIKDNYPQYLNETKIDKEAYIVRQIYWWVKELRMRSIEKEIFFKRLKMIKIIEYIKLTKFLFYYETWDKIRFFLFSKKEKNINSNIRNMIKIKGVNNIHEFSIWIKN